MVSREKTKIGNEMTIFVTFYTICVTFYLFFDSKNRDEKMEFIGRAKCAKYLPKKNLKKSLYVLPNGTTIAVI